MGKRKQRKSTPTEVNQWLAGVAQRTRSHILLLVQKYDEGQITWEQMGNGIEKEVDKSVNMVYDDAFEDGVTRSVDVEDEDNPVSFELEEEEDEDEDKPTRH